MSSLPQGFHPYRRNLPIAPPATDRLFEKSPAELGQALERYIAEAKEQTPGRTNWEIAGEALASLLRCTLQQKHWYGVEAIQWYVWSGATAGPEELPILVSTLQQGLQELENSGLIFIDRQPGTTLSPCRSIIYVPASLIEALERQMASVSS